MNYTSIYNSLIEKAKNRTIFGYTERHHIIPKCIGGLNNSDNLVKLTPEEHYIAHLLLVKMYPKEYKLTFAANMMANRNNKVYGWIKRKFGKEISAHLKSKNIKRSDEERKKRSDAQKGRKKSKEWKQAVSNSHLQTLEYNGINYLGYDELYNNTGISRHLYLKYYKNGIDPVQFVGDNLHGLRKCPPARAATGKKWYNNSIISSYFIPGNEPIGWKLGRLKNNNDMI